MTLLAADVTPETQAQRNTEVTKLREDIAQARAALDAEKVALEAESQRIQAEAFKLSLDQAASNVVLHRRHQSRLPPDYEARDLFNTPGAGPSNPPEVNWVGETPAAGAPVQPRVADPPRLNLTPPQRVPTPPGHFSNPLDNMIAAASRLAALPVQGESPAVVEARKALELLQTAVAHQAAYSHSREKIHSTPRPSRSYSRHLESPAVSSSE